MPPPSVRPPAARDVPPKKTRTRKTHARANRAPKRQRRCFESATRCYQRRSTSVRERKERARLGHPGYARSASGSSPESRAPQTERAAVWAARCHGGRQSGRFLEAAPSVQRAKVLCAATNARRRAFQLFERVVQFAERRAQRFYSLAGFRHEHVRPRVAERVERLEFAARCVQVSERRREPRSKFVVSQSFSSLARFPGSRDYPGYANPPLDWL